MDLDKGSHSVYNLNYHLVLVVKYRRNVIDEHISNRLKELFEYVGISYGITITEWNSDKDHIHCLFKAKPNTNISKFLNSYKSMSSRLIKKEYPIIRKFLWKEHFWSPSYCFITTGGTTIEVIKRYIESQGKD